MLATKSTEDVVSHLYVTEAYYFNPKQVKRTQLVRLIGMVQENMGVSQSQRDGDTSYGGQDNFQNDKAREARRRNFFEKKRFNNPYNNPAAEEDSSDAGQNNGGHGIMPGQQRRGATNANVLN